MYTTHTYIQHLWTFGPLETHRPRRWLSYALHHISCARIAPPIRLQSRSNWPPLLRSLVLHHTAPSGCFWQATHTHTYTHTHTQTKQQKNKIYNIPTQRILAHWLTSWRNYQFHLLSQDCTGDYFCKLQCTDVTCSVSQHIMWPATYLNTSTPCLST